MKCLWGGEEGGNRALIFYPLLCLCAQIKHPSAQRFDFRAVPSAGRGARTHLCISSPFQNTRSRTLVSLFCLSQYTEGYCSCKKTQPLISPQSNRNLLIHPAQKWNIQLIGCDLGLLQVRWALLQGRGKDCNTTLHSSHFSNPCLIKCFTLPFPKQDEERLKIKNIITSNPVYSVYCTEAGSWKHSPLRLRKQKKVTGQQHALYKRLNFM